MVTSPIYRNRSYAEGKGNAKRAGIGRDGTARDLRPLLLPMPNPVPYGIFFWFNSYNANLWPKVFLLFFSFLSFTDIYIYDVLGFFYNITMIK